MQSDEIKASSSQDVNLRKQCRDREAECDGVSWRQRQDLLIGGTEGEQKRGVKQSSQNDFRFLV